MDTFIAWVERGIGYFCRAILYVTLAVTFLILSANVGLRYAMGSSLTWASELPELLFPWMIMAGVVIAAQSGSHIAVVILTQRLGASRRWVLAAGALIVAGLYLGLGWAALPLMEIAADEYSPILRVPGSVTVGCLVGGFVLLAITTLIRIPSMLNTEAQVVPGPEAHAGASA
ncbi:TRAP transporter small permease [Piscinibacter koreensis]|uniref:TRAP transporter small permease protein n=1 Tax=Piscinibacter koreensis TaxID=2742824 RepID=A0A7Y6NRG0_9BURK|nr:TRAP transporter small permease subunit [Schlegelella koreensis]NUZ07963.1 TRAP transporter small permease subunit [Schlegelella koreensis]